MHSHDGEHLNVQAQNMKERESERESERERKRERERERERERDFLSKMVHISETVCMFTQIMRKQTER